MAQSGKWRKQFLNDLVDHKGKLSRFMELALALGLVTHGKISSWFIDPGDPKESIRLVEGTDWEKEKEDGNQDLADMFNDPAVVSRLKDLERRLQ